MNGRKSKAIRKKSIEFLVMWLKTMLTDEEIKNNMLIEMIPRRDNTQGWVTLNK